MVVPREAGDSGAGDWAGEAVEVGKDGESGDPSSASCAFLPPLSSPGPGVPICKVESQGELASGPF